MRVLRRHIGSLALEGQGPVEFGRLHFLGAGLSRLAFSCRLEIQDPPPRWVEDVVVLLRQLDAPEGDEVDERSTTQALLLENLGDEELNFSVPRMLGVYEEQAGLALVNQRIFGMPVDLRVKRTIGGKPWDIVGSIAAEIHDIDVWDWHDFDDLQGYDSCIEHALAEIEEIEELVGELSEATEMVAWAKSHLPPDEPSCLVHGDLLGQNILLSWADDAMSSIQLGVIDWEFGMMADPAYELAVVTRGVRRPFQVNNGLSRLMRAYRRAGGQPLTEARVRLYELCLAAHWFNRSLDDEDDVDSPEEALIKLRSTFRRALASSKAGR